MSHALPSDGSSEEPAMTAEVQSILRSDWPVVSVRWVDAEARGGPGWEDAEDLIEFAMRPLAEVLTVGLMVYCCDLFVALTDSRGPDQVGAVQKIPRAWIIAMDELVPCENSTDSIPIDDARMA